MYAEVHPQQVMQIKQNRLFQFKTSREVYKHVL